MMISGSKSDMNKAPNSKKMWYLASPYSSGAPWHLEDNVNLLLEIRHIEIQAIAVKLINLGYKLIEPIGSCHYKQEHYDLPKEYGFWQERDRAFIDHCDGVIVATMQGWDSSTGVSDEIEYAKTNGKQVWTLNPETGTFWRLN